ncbi:hypothetical protein L6452_08939 [Arctium lappa]|uniref:Uncharacterized protein n=1 Tax=Arctium lappa TaxID=4217 RepID=A0ACB9DJ02_ARCLA|nr:hypothetical protein L6452_08939 [Arctium lappa]
MVTRIRELLVRELITNLCGAKYRRIMEENLTLDREGRPFKMIVFRGSSKLSRKSIRYIDELHNSDEELFNHNNNSSQQRTFTKKESRILDAPYLKDDFYMNVMDWGKNNIMDLQSEYNFMSFQDSQKQWFNRGDPIKYQLHISGHYCVLSDSK